MVQIFHSAHNHQEPPHCDDLRPGPGHGGRGDGRKDIIIQNSTASIKRNKFGSRNLIIPTSCYATRKALSTRWPVRTGRPSWKSYSSWPKMLSWKLRSPSMSKIPTSSNRNSHCNCRLRTFKSTKCKMIFQRGCELKAQEFVIYYCFLFDTECLYTNGYSNIY